MSNEHTRYSFHFEEFTGVPRDNTGPFCVSLYKSGRVFLCRKAMAALGNPERVILLYDRHKAVIGIKPTYNPVPHAVTLRPTGAGCQIRVATFLEAHKIAFKYSIRFLEPYVEEDGTLILDLNRATRVVGPLTIARQRAEAAARANERAGRSVRDRC